MKQVVVAFKNYSFTYESQRDPTLIALDLEIFQGQKVAIIGASGSGKSTIGHAINGLIPHFYPGKVTGKLELKGQVCHSIFDASTHVGTVLQDQDAQFIGLTVAEDIAFAMENDLVTREEMHQKVAQIANWVGIEDLLACKPEELSGGQKQQVSLAGVMVNELSILLYDEPLANLDPLMGERAIELIDHLHHDKKLTTIIIEHRLEELLHRSLDRIILINQGRIVADLTPDALLRSNLLEMHKIRLPLYLGALKYAQCDLNSIKDLSCLEQIDFSPFRLDLLKWMSQYPALAQEESASDPLLKIEDLHFSYDDQPLLQAINMEIPHCQMVSIVGANGAGKSTLSKVICGFERAQSGRILLDQEDLHPLSIAQRAQKIGLVLQNPNAMIAKHFVHEEITLGLQLRKADATLMQTQLDRILKICGLSAFRDWPVFALSYGQKKRLSIASILALDPKVLIVDEPTAGQDYAHYHELMEFFHELTNHGVSILFITHDMHLMLEYTKIAYVFAKGKLIAKDTPSAILSNPAILEQAHLKATSLQYLANALSLSSEDLLRAMIAQEAEEVEHG